MSESYNFIVSVFPAWRWGQNFSATVKKRLERVRQNLGLCFTDCATPERHWLDFGLACCVKLASMVRIPWFTVCTGSPRLITTTGTSDFITKQSGC